MLNFHFFLLLLSLIQNPSSSLDQSIKGGFILRFSHFSRIVWQISLEPLRNRIDFTSTSQKNIFFSHHFPGFSPSKFRLSNERGNPLLLFTRLRLQNRTYHLGNDRTKESFHLNLGKNIKLNRINRPETRRNFVSFRSECEGFLLDSDIKGGGNKDGHVPGVTCLRGRVTTRRPRRQTPVGGRFGIAANAQWGKKKALNITRSLRA